MTNKINQMFFLFFSLSISLMALSSDTSEDKNKNKLIKIFESISREEINRLEEKFLILANGRSIERKFCPDNPDDIGKNISEVRDLLKAGYKGEWIKEVKNAFKNIDFEKANEPVKSSRFGLIKETKQTFRTYKLFLEYGKRIEKKKGYLGHKKEEVCYLNVYLYQITIDKDEIKNIKVDI